MNLPADNGPNAIPTLAYARPDPVNIKSYLGHSILVCCFNPPIGGYALILSMKARRYANRGMLVQAEDTAHRAACWGCIAILTTFVFWLLLVGITWLSKMLVP